MMSAPAVAGKARAGEWATALVAGLLLVVASPQVLALYWTPKVALALLVIGPGLVALILAARGHDRAALAALAFLLIAGLATLLSPAPKLSLFGLYNHGTGWIFIAVVVGMWALGRRFSVMGAQRLEWVLLVAATVNGAMVWLQNARTLNGAVFKVIDGRPPGLLGNPVHATALFLGAFGLATELWRRERIAAHPSRERMMILLALALLFASGIELAGGRTGIVVLVAVVVVAVVRIGARRAVPLGVVLVLGVGAASFAAADGTGAASRVAGSGGSAFAGRIDRWKLARPAVEARPLLGVGPGLYRRGTSRYATAASARAFGPDSLNIDAHNLVVEYLVTTGVLGTIALLAWLGFAGRGARGPLMWFAALGGVSLLVQPEFVGLTPVLALALGASKRGPPARSIPWPMSLAAGAAVLVAIIAGVGLLRGDARQREAVADLDPATSRAAVRAIPVWPEPDVALAHAYSSVARTKKRPTDWRRAIAAARAARRRDPSAPEVLITLGGLELAHGSVDRAKVAYEDAMKWNPESVIAALGLANVASRQDHQETSNRWCLRAKRFAPRLHCPVVPTPAGASAP